MVKSVTDGFVVQTPEPGEFFRFRGVRFDDYRLAKRKTPRRFTEREMWVNGRHIPAPEKQAELVIEALGAQDQTRELLANDRVARDFADLEDDQSFLDFVQENGLVLRPRTRFETHLGDGVSAVEAIADLKTARDNLRKLFALCDTGTEKVKARALPKIMKQWEAEVLPQATMALVATEMANGDVRPVLIVEPSRLVDHMFILAVQELAGGVEWRACAHCGTRFGVGPRPYRQKNSEFCSPNCKVDSHRSRTREA